MRNFKCPFGIFFLLGGLLISHTVLATNGYFPHGIGVKNKAMAGAGMALPEDAISIVNNPAVAVLLDDRTDVGLAVFQPRRNFTTFYEGSKGENNSFTFDVVHTDSDKDVYLVPEVARTRQLKNDSAFAWAFYMRTGIGASIPSGGTTFDPDGNGIVSLPGTFGDNDAAMDISQAYVDITWAKKVGKSSAFGVSAVLAAQSVKLKGTGGLAKYTEIFATSGGSEMPEHLSGNGRDVNYGVGLKIGFHHEFGQHFSFGAMYQSQINISSSGDYSDFFADGGNIDIPSWLRLGLTWKPIDGLSFSLDTQQIFYSSIDALSNSFTNVYDCPSAGFGGTDLSRCMGGKKGPGFGWKDVPIHNIGGSWTITDRWTVLAGFSFADQPTPIYENVLNSLMINMTEAHYTAGVVRKLSNGHELGFSLMYTEEESLLHPNQLDPNQDILLTTDQFDFQVSYSWAR